MYISSVQSFSTGRNGNRQRIKTTKQIKTNVDTANKVRVLSFTGKNIWQIASITPENKGLGLPEASQGGEGVVGFELPVSLAKHETVDVKLKNGVTDTKPVDVRNFMPFWSHNNPRGGYKFLIHREANFPNGIDDLPPTIPAKYFYSAQIGDDKKTVAKKLNIKESELSYVIQSRPDGVGPEAESKYCLLEPTGISGKITRLSEQTLGETEKIPYTLFEVSPRNHQKYFELAGIKSYFIYTPSLARASKPYAYDYWGNVPFEAEIANSDGMRALAEIIHKHMNTEEFGYFDPASVIAHDRIANTYGNHIANMSAAGDTAVNGVKTHIIEHNTGRNYQGMTSDPFKYQVVVGDASDAEVVRNLPEFELLKKAKQYGINSEKLTPVERQRARNLMNSYLHNFIDGAHTYNILKSGISAAMLNPNNVSVGTVSHNFDTEMKSDETPDAAKFLTGDFASIETKSVCNGATPANLKLDDKNAKWGQGNNGLGRSKGYTPFSYNPETRNIEEVIAAKEKNARWLTNLIWKAGQKGQKALQELFFNPGQIESGQNVLGYLSPIKDGEILVLGFGRADEQKGFPISTGGFLEFLKDKTVPTEMKQKVKVLLGAGPWDKGADDYKDIVKDLNEIWTLDGGRYKHNIMYIDGYTPNRFAGCVHYGLFTSRREMCGITPLECKIAGTPYGTTKTGGPVDYTNSSNGFLTKEAVELCPEHYGLSWENSAREIDQARVKAQSTQVAEIYKAMIEEYTNDRAAYVAKSLKNIEEKVDWHENSEYNNGKSANRRYLEDIFEVDKGWEARDTRPMKRVTCPFDNYGNKLKEVNKTIKSRPLKATIAVIIGGLAIASGVYLYITNNKKATAKANTTTNKIDKAA